MINYRLPTANLFDLRCCQAAVIQDGKICGFNDARARVYNFDVIDPWKLTGKSVDESRARELFENGSTIVDGNIFVIQVPQGFYKDVASAMEDLGELVSDENLRKFAFSTDFGNKDRHVSYSINLIPGSQSVQIGIADGGEPKDLAIIRFSTKVTLKNASVSIVKLDNYYTPCFYETVSNASARMSIAKAVLTYGDALEFVSYQEKKIFGGFEQLHYLVRKRVSDEDWARSFFFDLDHEFKGNVDSYVNFAQQFIGLDAPRQYKGPIKESYFVSNTGKYLVPEETKDVDYALKIIEEGIQVAKSFRFAPAKIRRSTINGTTSLYFIIESKDDQGKVLAWLQKHKDSILAWSEFVRNSLSPLHEKVERIWEPISYSRPEFTRAIAYYIFQQIRLDPVLYADHENQKIRQMAHELV